MLLIKLYYIARFFILTIFFLQILDICLLILILNAAKHSSTIIPLLEPHTLRHYAYLRDTMTQFVPVLSIPDSNCNSIMRPLCVPESLEFLNNVVKNLEMAETLRLVRFIFINLFILN